MATGSTGSSARGCGMNRKVVVGHWQEADVHERLGVWMRAASAWADSRRLKLARFGDNMREVAVTEGDKVDAQMQVRLLRQRLRRRRSGQRGSTQVTDAEVDRLVKEYPSCTRPRSRASERGAFAGQARIELGLRAFLADGGFTAFTDTFEDLHGLEQLPGLAVQRLMAEGYGFGAEGDWKTAALVRAMKVMATGLPGGTSFMEDYTYHLDPKGTKVLGAHMLEVCPPSPRAGPRSRSIPSASAARPIPRASCSRPPPGPPSTPRSSTSATASASSSTKSTWWRRTRPCRSSPSPGRCGCRGPTSRWRRRRGSTPAAPTTPLQPRGHPGAPPGLRRHGRRGVRADRRAHTASRAPQGAALERRLLLMAPGLQA